MNVVLFIVNNDDNNNSKASEEYKSQWDRRKGVKMKMQRNICLWSVRCLLRFQVLTAEYMKNDLLRHIF